jgi:outer membrane protein OmpA-like peptidoglycan-associated protein
MAALPVKVERLGSAHLRVEFSRQIQFKDGSTQLEPEALELLKQFAALLREHETVRIKITAHTDTRGSESRNQALSEQRAARIARVLAQAGIPESRISHVGKGESQPKIGPDEERSGGAWINRRIEIDLVE